MLLPSQSLDIIRIGQGLVRGDDNVTEWDINQVMVLAVLSPSGAALYICHECALSVVCTCPDIPEVLPGHETPITNHN